MTASTSLQYDPDFGSLPPNSLPPFFPVSFSLFSIAVVAQMVHINQNLYKLQGDNFLNSPAFHGQKHFFMRISKLFKILGNALSVDEMIFQSVIQEYCLSATENLSQTLSRVIIILHLARLLEVIEDEQRNKPS